MSMSSYEVVTRAVEFRKPDRLPLQFASLGVDDTHKVGWNQIGTGDNEQRQTVDEWGCVWQRTDMKNMGQVKGHPLEDWNAAHSFHWPDADNPAFYEGMEAKFEGSSGKYIITGIFMLLFERMHAVRGFANVLTDLMLERERVELLADRIVEYDLAIIENISRRFPGQIHGFTFSDDWGTQQATIIRPNLWNEFFKPRYKRIFDAAHDAGWHVWMHSCGRINAIIQDLIEINVDVLNLQQPRALGIDEIGEHFAGRVCFSSLCDIQRTLPFESEEAIRAEAELLLHRWATADGGFILSDYGDGRAIGVDPQIKETMLEAFVKSDRWR